MNGRKIYKTLKTHVKTHPVALLLYFFFFFIVSKPPSLTLPSWVLKVPSRFMLPAKNANVIFLLTKDLKDLKNWFESVRTLQMKLEFATVGLLRGGEIEKNLSK